MKFDFMECKLTSGYAFRSRAAMLNRYVQFLQEVHDAPAPELEPRKEETQPSEKVCNSNQEEPTEEGVVAVCSSDEIASLQSEEMEVLDSIFPSEIKLMRELPTAAGDPTVSFSVQLSFSGDPLALPCAQWVDSLSLLVTLPTQYPLQGVPQLQISAGKLGMDQFGSAHRGSLLRAVRSQVELTAGAGEMVLLDCIQTANDWLSGEGWKVELPETSSNAGGGGMVATGLDDDQGQTQVEGEKGEESVFKQEQEWITAATEEACQAAAAASGGGGETRKKESNSTEDGPERHSGGVWKYTVGLVGKPSAGKVIILLSPQLHRAALKRQEEVVICCITLRAVFLFCQHHSYHSNYLCLPLLSQSTFFNAVTRAVLDSRGGRKVAEVAAHPFTTIEPNIGPGWYLSAQDDCSEDGQGVGEGEGGERGSLCLSSSQRSSAYGRAGAKHRRLLPVVVKDVAGLVPGTGQGKQVPRRPL